MRIGSAAALVDVAGGETTPFPRAAITAAPAAVAALAHTAAPAEEPGRGSQLANAPVGNRGRSPWLWIGLGAAALLAGGAAAASQSHGSSSSGTPVQQGPGSSTLTVDTTP